MEGVNASQTFELPIPPCPWGSAAPSAVFNLGHALGVGDPQLGVTEPHLWGERKLWVLLLVFSLQAPLQT